MISLFGRLQVPTLSMGPLPTDLFVAEVIRNPPSKPTTKQKTAFSTVFGRRSRQRQQQHGDGERRRLSALLLSHVGVGQSAGRRLCAGSRRTGHSLREPVAGKTTQNPGRDRLEEVTRPAGPCRRRDGVATAQHRGGRNRRESRALTFRRAWKSPCFWWSASGRTRLL